MTPEQVEKNILATDEDVFPAVVAFVMANNPAWLPELQEFLDNVSDEFIPFIMANRDKGATKMEIWLKDMEREIKGLGERKGFVYAAVLNVNGPKGHSVVKGYELFFPVGENGKPTDIIPLARASEMPSH